MNLETLFSIAGALVLPGWALLIFLPRWKWTARLIAAVLIPGVLAVLYLYLVVAHLFAAEGGFGSLAQVALLFENPAVLLAGWVHYLAFDLFIGAWEVRDARRIGVRHLFVVPCLLLTFMLGPAGLLLYLVLRGSLRKKLWIDEGATCP
jgi:hypothetical protein